MICPNCNEELNNNEKTCPKCGKDIIPIIDIVTQSAKKESKFDGNNTLPAFEGTVEPPKISNEEELINPSLNNYKYTDYNETPHNHKKSNKKLFIISGIILLTVIIIISVILLKPKEDTKIVNFSKEEKSPILIKMNDKYGYIDSKGKVIIEPTYEYATSFKNGYALASNSSKSEYNIIDTNNEIKERTASYYKIEYDEENEVWLIDHKLYNKDLELISDDDVNINNYADGYYIYYSHDGRIATVLNAKGDKVYTKNLGENHEILMYESNGVSEAFSNKYCRVSLDKIEFAIVNCETGKMVMDYTGKIISAMGNNIFKIENINHEFIKYIYIKDDKILLSIEDESITFSHEEMNNYFTLQDIEDSSYIKYLDINTGDYLDSKPDGITEFGMYTGYKIVESNGKYGMKSGFDTIIQNNYNKITFLDINLYLELNKTNKEYILLTEGNKTMLYNLYNNLTEATFNNSEVTINGSFIQVEDLLNNKILVYNLKTNKYIEIEENKSGYVYDNYVTVKNNDNVIYYNENLEEIYTEEAY